MDESPAGTRPRSWLPRLALLAALTFWLPRAAAQELTANDLKALYLFRFIEFVTWPEGVVEAGAPTIIGVFADEEIADRLEQLVRLRGSQARPMEIRRFASLEFEPCHALFIGAPASRRLGRILEMVGDFPTLTVGDDATFAARGCVIGFYENEGRVRFAINERAAAQSGLVLSSKLLRTATAP